MRIAILSLDQKQSSILQIIHAASISIDRGGSGIIDPITGNQADALKLRFIGPISTEGQQSHYEAWKNFNIHNLTNLNPFKIEKDNTSFNHKAFLDMEDFATSEQTEEIIHSNNELADSWGKVESLFSTSSSSNKHTYKNVIANLELFLLKNLEYRLNQEFRNISNEKNDSETPIDKKYTDRLLDSDALIIHINYKINEIPESIQLVNELLTLMVHELENISINHSAPPRLKRIVLAIGDVGLSLISNGTTDALGSISSKDLMINVLEPILNQYSGMVMRLKRLSNSIEHFFNTGEPVELVCVPFDYFGDLSTFECLNRDPIDPSTMLIKSKFLKAEVLNDSGLENMRTKSYSLWRPFNLADIFFSTISQDIQSDTVFILP